MRIQKREPVDVVAARLLEGTFVLFAFSDGVEIPINLARFMRGPIFEDVLQNGTFGDFVVDEDSGTIVWPNGADLDPEVLRYTADDFEADDDFDAKARQVFVRCADLEDQLAFIAEPKWLSTSTIRTISEHPVVHFWDVRSMPAYSHDDGPWVAPLAVKSPRATQSRHRVLV